MTEAEAKHRGGEDADTFYASKKAQYYALILMLLIYACHSVDRQIVGVVTEPIREEFGATDTQMGAITLFYTLAFVLAMLPVGLLIDRTRRVRLLAILVACWGSLTALAGFATGIGGLIAARMGVGAAEAGGHPTSMALISDIVPKERRGSAIGIFYVATGLGGFLAFAGGGYIAAEYGWRATFFFAGVPGLLLALLCLLTLREPRRGGADGVASPAKAPPLGVVVAFVVSTPAVLNIAISGMLASGVNGSFATWQASYFMRTHGFDLKEVGVVGALGHGVLQAMSAFASGFIADWFARKKPHRAGYVATIAMLAMAPIGIAFTLAPTAWLAVAMALATGLCAGAWMAPTYTVLTGITPPAMRGAVIALAQILAAVGAGFGPFFVGMISDGFGGQLHIALTIGMAVSAWAGLHSLAGMRYAARHYP